MKRFGVFSAVVGVLMLATVAYADTRGINFEPTAYAPGSIQGQDGWNGSGMPILLAIDQAVVTNGVAAPASFGTQSWRFSNAYTDGAFGHWPFAPSLTEEAGEFAAESGGYSTGPRQTHFDVQLSFASTVPTAEQVGLQMSTAPDRGDGARMSYIRLEDNPGGLEVFFDDYQRGVAEPAGVCLIGDNFVETSVASGLNRALPHSVKLAIDFVDGPANDVVKVYVDGSLRHTGTSWEDYFRD